MDAKELMIGDWVLCDTNAQSDDEFDNVNYQPYRIQNGNAIDYATESNKNGVAGVYQPIPLTEEILKANGFEEVDGEKGMCGVTIAPYFKRDDSPRIYCDGDPFAVWFEHEVNIQYVHQLQHVLRLCGAKKEIVIGG